MLDRNKGLFNEMRGPYIITRHIQLYLSTWTLCIPLLFFLRSSSKRACPGVVGFLRFPFVRLRQTRRGRDFSLTKLSVRICSTSIQLFYFCIYLYIFVFRHLHGLFVWPDQTVLKTSGHLVSHFSIDFTYSSAIKSIESRSGTLIFHFRLLWFVFIVNGRSIPGRRTTPSYA